MPTSRTVLVIEEEPLLAIEIEDVLVEHRSWEIQHYRSVAEAEAQLGNLSSLSLAIVDARLGATPVIAFTQRLVEAGVPLVVMSADRASPPLFPHAIPLLKPFDDASLLAACDEAMRRVSSGAEA